jgi:hypothetical protein
MTDELLEEKNIVEDFAEGEKKSGLIYLLRGLL